MGPTIIARNYAETLLTLAQRQGGTEAVDAYARAIDEVAELLQREPRVREFLETPRIAVEAKQRVLRATFAGRVPDLFLRFLLVVVEKRRQTLLQAIAREFAALVDQVHNRVRAEVVLARPGDEALEREIVASLERKLGKTVIATVRVDPSLIGGVLIRIGDQVADGSVRRQVNDLRRRLKSARLPRATAR